ncbi:MAG: glycine betaine ABC transporter substrate-binding protein [Hyphomicrobiales bacterium]
MNSFKVFLAATTMAVGFATAAQAGDADTCKAVRFADVGWTEIQVISEIASNLYNALGYTGEVKTLSVPVTFASLKSKDVDVFFGNWMPSQTGDIKAYLDDKSVEQLTVNMEGAGYGIVVPQYVADAGVKDLADLAANKDKFGSKMFGIESGNDGNRIMQGFIDDPKNNLSGWTVVESSEAGMLTEAEKAMKNNEWIVFLGWTPHPVMGEMKLHYLSGVESAGFGAASVYTDTRAGWAAECPNAAKLASNMKFTVGQVGSTIMAPVLKDGKDPKVVATEWIKANPDTIKTWLDGVTTLDGGDAMAAAQALLK